MISKTGFVICLCALLNVLLAEDVSEKLLKFRSVLEGITTEQIDELVNKHLPLIHNIFNHHIDKVPDQFSSFGLDSAESPASYSDLVSIDSPAHDRSKFSQAHTKAIIQAEHALLTEKIAKTVMHQFNLKMLHDLDKVNISGTILKTACTAAKTDKFLMPNEEPIPTCYTNKYRTFNGSCNNIVDQVWGQSFTKYQRFLNKTAYGDEISAPRNKSVLGGALPPVRLISNNVIISKSVNKVDDHPNWTHYFAEFGQFLDHDLTNTPQFRAFNEPTSRKCCVPNPSEECFPIDTTGDPLFQKFNMTCMEFLRSLAADNTGCKFGPREQINQATAYIDGSHIYGTDDKMARSLMDPKTGKLKATCIKSGLLPPKKGSIKSKQCSAIKESKPECDFVTGDSRVNTVPGLVSLHTIWLRHHNNLVDLLKQEGWEDPEELYQEARRIVAAQLQFITYNEFLTIIFRVKMRNSELPNLNISNPIKYDVTVHPSMFNEFATAAYRFGHSMVDGIITLSDRNLKPTQSRPEKLSDHFFHPYDFYKSGQADRYIRSGLIDHAQDTNNIMTDQLTNFLFKKPNSNIPGLDLASLNLQRGRDHGIPSYVHYREECNLMVPKTFEDLKTIMFPECVKSLGKTYRDVADIDLWIGGLCENTSTVGAVGPTFGCIIEEQFTNIRLGDRFFFNSEIPSDSGMDISFSREQIKEIEKTTLSRIICRNSDLKEIHPSAMLFLSNEKPISCKKLLKDDMNIKVFTPRPLRSQRINKSKPINMKQLVETLLYLS